MSHLTIDVIRVWKDPEYRAALSDEERATLPANPAGMIELAPAELNKVVGSAGSDSAQLTAPALKTYVCVFCCSQASKAAFNFGAPR